MKSFHIFFLLAVAATGEALGEICNSRKTPTKLIARRTWPGQTASTTAKPTTNTTTASPKSTITAEPSTTTPTTTTTTTMATTTTPLPILFNCSVSDPACGTMCTNLTSGGGVVQSPNFPGDYGNEFRYCGVTIVIIIVPAGKRIRLTFTTFNLETGKGSIKGNDRITTYLDSVTGSTIPDVVTTTSNVMLLQFISSRSTKPNTAIYNWQATYTAV
ncbi:blastula protease 10-like isoform X1 [Daphnia pulicaria]|uniref:blastula protease 10-like isoform X1 n=1 Tax=Daphnia pulicaria TaxID=35523 RepID=UPI001EEA541B|nr:blastula protease 10-like isoform X1 [Daphnia pulicaria]